MFSFGAPQRPRKSSDRSQPSRSSSRAFYELADGIEAIDISDNEDGKIPTIDLSGVDDEEGLDGQEHIREFTPIEVFDVDASSETGHAVLASISVQGAVLEPGVDVELADGSFLRIKRIIRSNTSASTHLEGLLMRRLSDHQVQSQVQKWMNDLIIIQQIDIRQRSNKTFHTVPLSDFLAIRQIVFTNAEFPAHSIYAGDYVGPFPKSKEARKESCKLVCRWIWITWFESSGSKTKGKVVEEEIRRLDEKDCDPNMAVPEPCLVRKLLDRDEKNLTSGSKRKRSEVTVISDGEDDDDIEFIGSNSGPVASSHPYNPPQPHRKRAFGGVKDFFNVRKSQPNPRNAGRTYGDICAGAGGVARAAVLEGFVPLFLLDKWADACATLRLSFDPYTTHQDLVLEMDIFDFCAGLSSNRDFRVDVLHISFPCQPHSPAHTVPGKDDEQNIAAMYSVIPLLKICKPRVVTFEQTSGIMTHNAKVHFYPLIHQITSVGYSVRFRIANCADFGNVHARKRAFILAAAPGQKLPDFPEPTHGVGLKPRTTIRDVLRCVPGRVDDYMKRFSNRAGRCYDPNTPLKDAITTNGGKGDVHPNGWRSFTLQELAMLGGFPAEHRFAEATMTSLRKQIGNAVPVCAARALYREINKALDETDRKVANWKPEVVVLD